MNNSLGELRVSLCESESRSTMSWVTMVRNSHDIENPHEAHEFQPRYPFNDAKCFLFANPSRHIW